MKKESWKFLGGGGVFKDPQERKFQGGREDSSEEPSMGGMDIFWNHTMHIVQNTRQTQNHKHSDKN